MFRTAVFSTATISQRVGGKYSRTISLRFLTTIQFRDVLIYDNSFSSKSWEEIHEKGQSTKHPASGHVVAQYSSYLHNHSKYNFNSLGEFSLIMTSAIPLSVIEKGNTDSISLSEEDKTHSVMIHPDGLLISNITTAEISTITNLILNEEIIESAAVKKMLPEHCKVNVLPPLVIIATTNKQCSMKTATKVLSWFRTAVASSLHDKLPSPHHTECSTLLLLASELGGHRNSSTVLLLPSEDSFEHVSTEENAKTILNNCINGTRH